MRAMLKAAGFKFREDDEVTVKLAKLRGMYEPYVNALAEFFYMEVPPWILAKEAVDNWRTSAWGRTAGFSAALSQGPDDHADKLSGRSLSRLRPSPAHHFRARIPRDLKSSLPNAHPKWPLLPRESASGKEKPLCYNSRCARHKACLLRSGEKQ